jgi:hypothetical protein
MESISEDERQLTPLQNTRYNSGYSSDSTYQKSTLQNNNLYGNSAETSYRKVSNLQNLQPSTLKQSTAKKNNKASFDVSYSQEIQPNVDPLSYANTNNVMNVDVQNRAEEKKKLVDLDRNENEQKVIYTPRVEQLAESVLSTKRVDEGTQLSQNVMEDSRNQVQTISERAAVSQSLQQQPQKSNQAVMSPVNTAVGVQSQLQAPQITSTFAEKKQDQLDPQPLTRNMQSQQNNNQKVNPVTITLSNNQVLKSPAQQQALTPNVQLQQPTQLMNNEQLHQKKQAVSIPEKQPTLQNAQLPQQQQLLSNNQQEAVNRQQLNNNQKPSSQVSVPQPYKGDVKVDFCFKTLIIHQTDSDEKGDNDWYFWTGIKNTKAYINLEDYQVPSELRNVNVERSIEKCTSATMSSDLATKLTVEADGYEYDFWSSNDQLGKGSMEVNWNGDITQGPKEGRFQGGNADYKYTVVYTLQYSKA